MARGTPSLLRAAWLAGTLAVASADDGGKAGGDASIMLLGGVAFIVAIFYMTNCRASMIRNTAWSMISAAVSIFSAVMTYNLFNAILNDLFGMQEPDEGPPTASNLTSRCCQLVGWWLAVNAVLLLVRRSLLHLKSYGTIGGHILGFAALSFYGQIATTSAFKGSALMIILDILIYIVTMGALFGSTRFLHGCSQHTSLISDADDDRLHDQSKDTGTDFFCMGLSYLLYFLIQRLILGGRDIGGDTEDLTLGGVGVLFLAACGSLSVLNGRVKEGTTLSAVMDVVSTVTALTSAWCLLFAAWWKAQSAQGDTLMAHVSVAIFFSALSLLFVLTMAAVAEECRSGGEVLRGEFTAISLVVGMSWEKVFDAALDGSSEYFAGDGDPKHLKTLFTLLLLLTVFPAWMLYMLPKADTDIQKALAEALAHGPLPLRACCCSRSTYALMGTGDSSEEDESE